MGKVKTLKGDKISRPTPLGDQLSADVAGASKLLRRTKRDKEEPQNEEFLNQNLTARILHQARKQQAQLMFDDDEDDYHEKKSEKKRAASERFSEHIRSTQTSALSLDSSDDEEDYDVEDAEKSYFPDIDVCPEDEEAFERFMPKNKDASHVLISQSELKKKKQQVDAELIEEMGEAGRVAQIQSEMDPRLLAMYRGIRDVLRVYRSGKLPKAFKVIPKLRHWEHILFLTEPTEWTAAAMYQATRIFASNLNSKMCQRFYSIILLPRVQDDIAEYKRLNFHLYQALAKALFKPAAFFKGILLPLCESGICTLREATIIGSVMAKCSIPSLHAAAAMLKIAEMEYNGASSLFLRILIDKKYTLPFRVIDALVNHFLRFSMDDRHLPVLWHQALLTFAQRYKCDLSSEQREALLDLLKKHDHHEISPEIRRELTHAVSRDVEMG